MLRNSCTWKSDCLKTDAPNYKGNSFFFRYFPYLNIKFVVFIYSQIILHNLAMCHAFYKDYEKACVYFKELLRLQPEDVAIGTNYGRMLALSGEVDKAIEQLTRTLKIAEDKNEETLIEQVRFFLFSVFPWTRSFSSFPQSCIRERSSINVYINLHLQ